MIYEVGKSWVEADADTAEAIDFLEFYGREALRLGGPQPLVPTAGEKNHLLYIPLGVGAVIPPWNFACAIMVGLTSSALVAGNTVVLKPASTAALVAARFVELLDDAGVPAGVVNFLPGPGGVIGDALVTHPLTRFVSFTGSREVGLRINELAATQQPGQKWIKRAILEMGGKDSIVVDETADLDAAATAIVASAFGFQGQKCSACSRAIVVDSVYDQVLEKVVERAGKLSVGDTTDQAIYMGPVVDENAYKKIQDYIEIGKAEGKVALGGEKLDREGYFIAPTIIADVAPTARIAQEEIFGPVLAFIRAKDFDDALAIANNTEYGSDRSVLLERPRAHRARPSASSSPAISTSTASALARWSAFIRSAASTCRAPTPRRAARITCCSLRRRRLSPRRRLVEDGAHEAMSSNGGGRDRACAMLDRAQDRGGSRASCGRAISRRSPSP